MRLLLSILCLIVTTRCASLAAIFDNSLDGLPFQPFEKDLKIVWAITNSLPSSLWVYKVSPQKFDETAISNLLFQVDLGTNNQTTSFNPVLLSRDKEFRRFEAKNEKKQTLRRLDVSPSLGWIKYRNDSPLVNARKEPLENAPDIEAVRQLATNFSYRYSDVISHSQIDWKPRSVSVTTTERESSSETITNERGLFFSRKIDDAFDERGFCFSIAYGCHGGEPKLLAFEINWRNLIPFKSFTIADTNEAVKIIESGKATFPPQIVDLEKANSVKTILIKRFEILYDSKPPSEKIEYEFPYAEITAIGDYDTTNAVTFYLNCPIITTNSFSEVK